MTLETQMFQNAHSGSQWLLPPLTMLLLFAFADRQTGDLLKAVVKRDPPWIQVLKDDTVTLTCEGTHNPGNSSTQWFHNQSSTWGQVQASYTFKATVNDSGEYRCRMAHTSLSDPIHLEVISGSATASTSSLVWFHAAFCLVMCLLFAVDTGLYFCVRRNLQTSGEDWRKSLSVGKYKAPQDK
ncbi:Fc gamma receptor 2A like 1 isoform X4 [Rattus norvegicus]|uniref:Fc gamma receptor 2A like 1 isoform X4 n=1 Tax=Rattus norvegicus TaxID=10116 RepID=UPI00191754BF|nr:Fc gamma receptor II beta isoform X4 [Rattus norvegicus]